MISVDEDRVSINHGGIQSSIPFNMEHLLKGSLSEAHGASLICSFHRRNSARSSLGDESPNGSLICGWDPQRSMTPIPASHNELKEAPSSFFSDQIFLKAMKARSLLDVFVKGESD